MIQSNKERVCHSWEWWRTFCPERTWKSQVGITKAKQKPVRQLGEFALWVLRGLSTCCSARSCALALQVVCHAHYRGEALKTRRNKKQRDARLLSCVKPTRVNPCFGREKQPASAAGRDEPSCRHRPRKRRSERCDKHLDHMTLTTRLPLHVSVDFCHAQTCTQCSAALRDATAFLFFFFSNQKHQVRTYPLSLWHFSTVVLWV